MAAIAAPGRALALGIALLACGCAVRAPKASVGTSGPFTDRPPSAGEVIASLTSREQSLASFRGQARLVYEGPQGTAKSSQIIAVQSPDRVRIDVMSPFGPSYTVAAYGDRLRAYDRGEKVLYVGSATAENLRKYTRVQLKIDVLARLIRGLPPLINGDAAGHVEAEGAAWRWESRVEPRGLLRVDLDRGDLRPLRASFTASTALDSLSVEFDQYEDVDGIAVPHRIRARLGDGGQVELEYSRIWRAVQLTDTAFQIDPPSGVRVVGMDVEGADAGAL